MKQPEPIRPRSLQPPNWQVSVYPGRGSVHMGEPEKGTPKKGHTDKFCKWCKAVDGPSTTHDTHECRRFNKDGSQKDRLTKPFNSAKRTPWNKPSGGDPAQMAYLTEEIAKLKKRPKKSKKHKKRARESSDSDSDDS